MACIEIASDILYSDVDLHVADFESHLRLLQIRGRIVTLAVLVLLLDEAVGEGGLADGDLAKNLNRDLLWRVIHAIFLLHVCGLAIFVATQTIAH